MFGILSKLGIFQQQKMHAQPVDLYQLILQQGHNFGPGGQGA